MVLVVGMVILWSLMALAPIVSLVVVTFHVLAGAWFRYLTTEIYQQLIVGIGTSAALGGVCFGYARAAKDGTPDAHLGFNCGRLLLFGSAMLFMALVSEFARRDLLLDAIRGQPSWLRSICVNGLAFATGSAAICATIFIAIAIILLYVGGLRLIVRTVRT